MSEALAVRQPVAMTTRGIQITSLEDLRQFCQVLVHSKFCPQGAKAEDLAISIQYGLEVGLSPMQAIQNVAVINGRPSMWGDAMLGLIKASPVYGKFHKEWIENEGKGDEMVGVCQIKRAGEEQIYEERFSVVDAKKAKLWDKAGPWQTASKRMLKLRARGFCLRDAFPDVLRGLITREEAEDFPMQEPVVIHAVEVKRAPAAKQKAGPAEVHYESNGLTKEEAATPIAVPHDPVTGEVEEMATPPVQNSTSSTETILAAIEMAATLDEVEAVRTQANAVKGPDRKRVKDAFLAKKSQLEQASVSAA